MTYNILTKFLALALLLTACQGSKEALNAQSQSKEETRPLSNSLLWKIEGPDIVEPSYLFGTIHMIESDDYFLPEGTLEAIDQTDLMVFEIDMADMGDLSKMFEMFNQIMMKDGTTLKDLVSAEDYAFLEDHFSKMGMPMMMLDRIKPMFLSMMSGDIDMTDMQSGEVVSYEMKFYELAQANEKETAGLETMEFQMSLFDSIPYENQAKMLVESIKFADTENQSYEALKQFYFQQDIESLATLISSETSEDDSLEDFLLTRRNANWIPMIREICSQRSAFIAVGAGHLGGPQGVIRLLRKDGFTVTPVIKG